MKSVIGEESQLKSAEDRLSQSSIPAEVGIIVGKLNLHLERGFVYDLIPTPPTDGGVSACSLKSDSRDGKKKGSKAGKLSAEAIPSLLIDVEWVAEHARQVSRMLLGGMSVVGVYVWSSDGSFKATSASVFYQTIRAVAQATPSLERETNERLLIHISYSPKRWACRTCAVASVDLRPCDFRMSKLLAMLQTYRCMYGFDIRIPIFQDLLTSSNTFKNVLRSGISHHAKELQSARALLDGKLVMENQQVTSEGLHNVELLLPFKSDPQHGSSDDIAGLVVFRGAIHAYAYLSPKELATQAISDLKNDIINSLKSRLDIVLDEGEEILNMASNDIGNASDEILTKKPIHELILHELRKPLVLSFPRRVLVPWLPGIFVCDYLLPSETFEDSKDRCRELLSMQQTPFESSGLLELEAEAVVAASPITSSFWGVIGRNLTSSNGGEAEKISHSIGKKSSKKSKYFDFNIQVALFVLLLAVLIAGFVTVFQ